MNKIYVFVVILLFLNIIFVFVVGVLVFYSVVGDLKLLLGSMLGFVLYWYV